MDRSTPIVLVDQMYHLDQYGVPKPTLRKRTVYANVTSVTASEWFEGGRNGLNPEFRVRMFAPDYQGEQVLELNGQLYSIYRTYQARTDIIELYVQKKKGNDFDSNIYV